jgi:hypothetical protein
MTNNLSYLSLASRHFRNKKRQYLKDKIDEHATNSKNKNIRDLYRGINDFKRGHQPTSNLVKDENGDLLADSHNILIRWKNYFSHLTLSRRMLKYIRHCCPTSFGRMSNYVRTCLFRGSPFIFRSYCPRWPCMRYQRICECFYCLLLPSGSYSLNFLRSECHF